MINCYIAIETFVKFEIAINPLLNTLFLLVLYPNRNKLLEIPTYEFLFLNFFVIFSWSQIPS